jgi:hypothetical protein
MSRAQSQMQLASPFRLFCRKKTGRSTIRPSRRSRVFPLLESLEQRVALAPLIVNTTFDGPTAAIIPGTLRYAIQTLNASEGAIFEIDFQIGSGPQTISPLTPLPPILFPVEINGASQPGFNGSPLIEIRGSSMVTAGDGFDIETPVASISYLVIDSFPGSGISIPTLAASSVLNADISLEHNEIGTDSTGSIAEPNLVGITVKADFSGVGGGVEINNNLVSGNAGDGVDLTSIGGKISLTGNYIGTDIRGTKPLPNGTGIYQLTENTQVAIGSPSFGNVISGNRDFGIVIGVGDPTIQGNLIGTDASGASAVPNGTGIFSESSVTVGGTDPGDRNLISGNTHEGIELVGLQSTVEGNRIGTDASGFGSVPNGVGVEVFSGDKNTIGGTSPLARNVISGNKTVGILVYGGLAVVAGNFIGPSPTGEKGVGNSGAGIEVDSSGAPIGARGTGNLIAFNGGAGVEVPSSNTKDVSIRFNAIFGNAGPGIDLGNFGERPNTPLGPHDGPNALQNYPVLVSDLGGVIIGTLNSTPNSSFTIDFYANAIGDPVSSPQGRDWLLSTTVTTDAAGNATFNVGYTPMPGEPVLTATATDSAGDTSEFSAPLAPAVLVAGQSIAATAYVRFQGEVASFASADPDANANRFIASIDWGDGVIDPGAVEAAPGGFIVIGTHTFALPNPGERISVQVTDTQASGQATAHSVADVAPNPLGAFGRTVPFVEAAASTLVVASFTDADPRAFAGQFSAVIFWGDGQTSAGTVTADGAGFDVGGTHTYTRFGTYKIGVKFFDSVTQSEAQVVSTATVMPVPLSVVGRNFAVTGNKKFTGTVATFADLDPRIDPTFYTATVDWGDGTPASAGTITGTNPFTVTASHTYTAFPLATHLVTVTITDKNGRQAVATDRVVDPPSKPLNPHHNRRIAAGAKPTRTHAVRPEETHFFVHRRTGHAD